MNPDNTPDGTEEELGGLEILEELNAAEFEQEDETVSTEDHDTPISTEDEGPVPLWQELGLEDEGALRDHFKNTAKMQSDYSALVKSVNDGYPRNRDEQPVDTDEINYNAYPFTALDEADETKKSSTIHDFLFELGERPLEVMAHVMGPSVRYYVEEYVKHTLGQRDFADTMDSEQAFVEGHMDKFQELKDSGLSDEKALSLLKKFFPTTASPDTDVDARSADKKGQRGTKKSRGSTRPTKDTSSFGDAENDLDKAFREQIMNDFLADE